MGSPRKITLDDRPFEASSSYDDYSNSVEQEETWFLGSLIRSKKSSYRDYNRITTLHNRITHEETNFDERYQSNKRIASKLSEFFPYKWLIEITAIFRKIDSSLLGIKTQEDRICSYLGYIELYLTFRGLTLLSSTLKEINTSLAVSLSKSDIRKWKIKLLRVIPGLRNEWVQIREQTHQKALISVVVQVMNKELVLTDCTKEEIFQIKQAAIKIASEFISTSKGKHIKKPEIWARAICLKSLKVIIPNYPCLPFPKLSNDAIKVVENKRWQLDQLISTVEIIKAPMV